MKKWFVRIAWIVFSVIMLLLFIFIKKAQEKTPMQKPNIVIQVDGENAFLTKDELYIRLKRKNLIVLNEIINEAGTLPDLIA